MIVSEIKIKPKCILIVPDLHFPNEHPNTFKFLKAVKNRLKPDYVVQIGDLVDIGTVSQYTLEPEYISPKDEYEKSLISAKKFYKLFDQCAVILGNHDTRVLRKAKSFGVPECYFKDFKSLMEMPKGYKVYDHLKMGNTFFTHGWTKTRLKLAQAYNMNTVEGHFHEDFGVSWQKTFSGDYFCLRVGCLIDDKSIVFNYNKTNLSRPLLGCGAIVNGYPYAIPMPVDKRGLWTGKIGGLL